MAREWPNSVGGKRKYLGITTQYIVRVGLFTKCVQ
jgi:hypothetical protein